MSKVKDRLKCKHQERSCKYCFECDAEKMDSMQINTISKQILEQQVYSITAPGLSDEEKIILAALMLKRNSGREFDFQAGEVLKMAYEIEAIRVNLVEYM